MTPAEHIRQWRKMITEAERTEATSDDSFKQAREALDESVPFLRAKRKFLANPTSLDDDEYRLLWQHRDKLSPTALQRIRGIMARRRREKPSASQASKPAAAKKTSPTQAPEPASSGSANSAGEVEARVRSLGQHLLSRER